MKKIPLFIKILVPVFVVIAAAGVFLGIEYKRIKGDYESKAEKAASIEAIAPAQKKVLFTLKKEFSEYESLEDEGYEDENIFASYQYNNITFTSYSEAWGEDNLKALCDELLLNTHGDEIDYLAEVVVHGEKDEEVVGLHMSDYGSLEIPVSLFYMFPYGFTFSLPNKTSILTLYNGDEFTTTEQMADTLSHEYGHHFTFHYFCIEGDEDKILDDPYFKARYIDGLGIKYRDEEREDWDEYLEGHMWYLVEIAAEDYVYLMGSPNTKRTVKYYDTLEQLKMDVKRQKTKLDEYYEMLAEDSFNRMPHENVILPLPDQVDGLAELFYGAIGQEAPTFADRSAQAHDIEIKISRRSSQGHRFYSITWNKPWEDEDATYTLVAYDENDEALGPIKSINGNENAKAIIGSAVYKASSDIWYYPSDWWTEQGFLRFRVIVTFSDGTAAVSPPVEKEF